MVLHSVTIECAGSALLAAIQWHQLEHLIPNGLEPTDKYRIDHAATELR